MGDVSEDLIVRHAPPTSINSSISIFPPPCSLALYSPSTLPLSSPSTLALSTPYVFSLHLPLPSPCHIPSSFLKPLPLSSSSAIPPSPSVLCLPPPALPSFPFPQDVSPASTLVIYAFVPFQELVHALVRIAIQRYTKEMGVDDVGRAFFKLMRHDLIPNLSETIVQVTLPALSTSPVPCFASSSSTPPYTLLMLRTPHSIPTLSSTFNILHSTLHPRQHLTPAHLSPHSTSPDLTPSHITPHSTPPFHTPIPHTLTPLMPTLDLTIIRIPPFSDLFCLVAGSRRVSTDLLLRSQGGNT